MVLSADDYREQLIALLPSGAAWVAEPITTLYKLLYGLAEEPARVDSRANDLINEVDPRTTTELLADWERVLGLPEICAPDDHTTEERRAGVVTKLNAIGGQTPQYFIDLAETFGFTVTITEFRPFTAGSDVGTPLYGDAWAYYFQVNAPLNTISEFKVGQSTAGDPLRSWGNECLEYLFEKYKPAHTGVIFAYS